MQASGFENTLNSVGQFKDGDDDHDFGSQSISAQAFTEDAYHGVVGVKQRTLSSAPLQIDI